MLETLESFKYYNIMINHKCESQKNLKIRQSAGIFFNKNVPHRLSRNGSRLQANGNRKVSYLNLLYKNKKGKDIVRSFVKAKAVVKQRVNICDIYRTYTGLGWDWSQVRGTGSSIRGHKGVGGGIVPFLKIANDVALAVDQLGCVDRNSYVRLIDKTVKITDVKIGDLILSFNMESGKPEWKTIEETHEVFVAHKDQIKISFENGGYITTSKWHPLAIFENNKFVYKRSDEVKIGNFGVDQNGNLSLITAIDLDPKVNENYFDLSVESNNNYFCSTDHETNQFHLIHNTRKGSINTFIESWHWDIEDFIDLRKNSGDERRRTHDLFVSLWINDLFMERVGKNQEWTLFDPRETSELNNLFGEQFKEKYLAYEHVNNIRKKKIPARTLYRKIITNYFETGTPFLGFKDEANRRNQNSHSGLIRSSNLCVSGDTRVLTENGYIRADVLAQNEDNPKIVIDGRMLKSGQNELITPLHKMVMTSENEEIYLVKMNDGSSLKCTAYHEFPIITNNGIEKKQLNELAENTVIYRYLEDGTKTTTSIKSVEFIGSEPVYDLTSDEESHTVIFDGIVTGNCMEIFQNTRPAEYKVINTRNEKVAEGRTAVCNLASINLAKVNSREDIERVVKIAMKVLDNVIDLNYYPIESAKLSNMDLRAVGLGVMGESQMLAERHIHFGTKEHYELIDEVMENVSFYAIKSSIDLAKELGAYPKFEGSNWSKGILPIDTANEKAKSLTDRKYSQDWDSIREDVKKFGIRNGYLMAVAPTSSISILIGTTQAIEPIYKRKWFENNLSGQTPAVAPNLSADTWAFYKSAYEIDQIKLIEAGAVRQKWIDQGQSLNLFVDPKKYNGNDLIKFYLSAWQYGLKSTYYLRSQAPEIVDRNDECLVCQ